MAKKMKPFFWLLKQPTDFHYDQQCEAMFFEFKSFLATLAILIRPIFGVELLLYLSILDFAKSSTLLEEKGRKQMPIYYIS